MSPPPTTLPSSLSSSTLRESIDLDDTGSDDEYYSWTHHLERWKSECEIIRLTHKGRRFGGTVDHCQAIHTYSECLLDRRSRFKTSKQKLQLRKAQTKSAYREASLHNKTLQQSMLNNEKASNQMSKKPSSLPRSRKEGEKGAAPQVHKATDDLPTEVLSELSVRDDESTEKQEFRVISGSTNSVSHTDSRNTSPKSDAQSSHSTLTAHSSKVTRVIQHTVEVASSFRDKLRPSTKQGRIHSPAKTKPGSNASTVITRISGPKNFSTKASGTTASSAKISVSNMLHLKKLQRPVMFRTVVISKDMPEVIRDLYQTVKNLNITHGYLPQELRSNIKLLAKLDEPVEIQFATAPWPLQEEGLLLELVNMMDIRDAASKFLDSKENEEQWNVDVHYPILRLAMLPYRQLKPKAATTIALDPTRMLFTNTEQPTNLLKIDYLLVVDNEHSGFIDLMEKALQSTGLKSIGPTVAEQLRHKPVAVIIKTKIPPGDDGKGKAQVGYWAAAYFSHLRILLGMEDGIVPMPLPLIIMKGPQVTLHFAVDGKDSIQILGGYENFGNLATMEGAYRTLVGLRLIAGWVEKTWRPWFEDNCLKPWSMGQSAK